MFHCSSAALAPAAERTVQPAVQRGWLGVDVHRCSICRGEPVWEQFDASIERPLVERCRPAPLRVVLLTIRSMLRKKFGCKRQRVLNGLHKIKVAVAVAVDCCFIYCNLQRDRWYLVQFVQQVAMASGSCSLDFRICNDNALVKELRVLRR